MTHTIPTGTTKSDRAIRFGKALTRAMAKREVGSRPLAEALGSSRTTIMYWRTGRILPRLDMVRRIAAALDDERLVTLATELRRKACLVDGVEFVDDSGSDNRQYCTAACQRLAEKKRQGSTIDKRAANAERRLTIHRQAVGAYCAGCEPSGRCVTPECPLRPVSPLPLYDERINLAPIVGGRKPLSEADRAARGLITTGSWARYTADERQARIDRAAEASKRARGLSA